MKNILSILKEIIVKENTGDNKCGSALKKQVENIKSVWDNKKHVTFGIERILRLILSIQPFVFPGLYIRHISGLNGMLTRKITNELYVIVKLLIPMFLLKYEIITLPLTILIIYLLSETILYQLALLFLSDIYKRPISINRNMLLLFINYLEVTIDYAYLYFAFKAIAVMEKIDWFYFSITCAATVGFGDYSPENVSGKIISITQMFVMMLFIVLFFTSYIARFGENNHWKEKKKT
jgi:hypothetical protein